MFWNGHNHHTHLHYFIFNSFLNLRKYLCRESETWLFLSSRREPPHNANTCQGFGVSETSIRYANIMHYKSPQSSFHVPVVTAKELFKSYFTSRRPPTVSLSLWLATKTRDGTERGLRSHTHTSCGIWRPLELELRSLKMSLTFWSPEEPSWLGPRCADDEVGKECECSAFAQTLAYTQLLWR